ncbi:HSP20-like chaperone [Xylariaceae sp. FL0804]|nr:HSP20-like chaperone [Xylariaceae sp. FL0804]
MSVFSSHPFYTTSSSPRDSGFGNFGGLVRFIDDWDKHFSSQQGGGRASSSQHRPQPPRCLQQQQQQQSRSSSSFFTPKFDLTETRAAYELHGELPGVRREDIHIEFIDPQTIQIRGRVERTRTAGTPPAGLLDHQQQQDVAHSISTEDEDHTMSGAVVNGEEMEHEEEEEPVIVGHEDHAAEEQEEKAKSRRSSMQATVEDENEDGTTTTSTTTATATAQPTPATTAAEVAASKPQPQPQPAPAAAETTTPREPQFKYWVCERSAGAFSRTFALPGRVDVDGVSAALDGGVLAVVVPKARRHEVRRIAVL